MFSKLKKIINGDIRINNYTKYHALAGVVDIIHVLLVCFFWHIGSVPMALYNVLSVFGYLLCQYMIKKNRLIWVFGYTYIEVVLHSILATYTVGWDFGFVLYIVAIIPVGFDMSFALADAVKGMKLSVLFGVFSFIGLVVCRFYSYDHDPIYIINNPTLKHFVYLCNIFCTVLLLLTYSLIFAAEIHSVQQNLKEKNKELAELATVDTLTGLYNRRKMHDLLDAAEKEGSFSLIMSDVDNFKHINDTYGHDSGDEVLKAVSEVIKECLPAGDNVCRWGGEEFLIITKGSIEKAAELAERIRKNIENKTVRSDANNINITITLGIAEYNGSLPADKVLINADKNLYIGKNSGKNCVIR